MPGGVELLILLLPWLVGLFCVGLAFGAVLAINQLAAHCLDR